MNARKLTELHERWGEKAFTVRMVNMINEGVIKQENFSLRALWEAMGRPRLITQELVTEDFQTEKTLFVEAMDSTAFTTITGSLINKVVQEAYDLEYGVGMNLVTKIPSSQKDDIMVGFSAMDGLKELEEGEEYQETSYGEKYHKVYNQKYGRRIALTEEMIKFDQTGQMIQRAQRIGEKVKSKQEEIIWNALCEKTSTGVLAAWRPGGTATTLYSNTSADPYTPSATLDNQITDVLADESDIDAGMTLFAGREDEEGDPIAVNLEAIAVNPGKASVIQKIFASPGSLVSLSPAVVNVYKGAFQPYSSPWITNISGAAYWYMGDFKKQFVYTEVFPLQVFRIKAGSEDEFKRDIPLQWKARFMGGCGAVTNRYVIESTGGG